MLLELQTAGVGPVGALDLRFAPRFNLITGDNGLGKTFLLDLAWWALSRTWAGKPARPREGAPEAWIRFCLDGETGATEPVRADYDFSFAQWSLPAQRPANPGLAVYARVDGSFSVWDPIRNNYRIGQSRNALFDWRVAGPPTAYQFTDREVWEGLSVGDRRPCEGLIRDWVSWQRAKAPEFETLTRVLRALSVPEEPILPADPIRVSIEDGFDTPAIATSYGVVPLTHASSGIRRVAGLAYLLVWAWREHKLAAELTRRPVEPRLVLLVDEPETHLHPRWQRLLLPALLAAVGELIEREAADIQILAATHSPLVLASMEPQFQEPEDALFDLDLEHADGASAVEMRHVPWRRRGDVNAWLTSEIFNLKTARNAAAEALLEAASRAIEGEPVAPATALELDGQLRRMLGDSDPFFIRWRYLGERAGWLS